MAAELKIKISAELTGLGDPMKFLPKKYTMAGTPTLKFENRQIQAVADTEEALYMGGITTPMMIIMKCVSNDVDVDVSFNSTFSAEITIEQGETQVFKPVGTVYIKNDDAGEVSTVDYIVVGT
jgi:hypothetical protein